MMESYVWEDVGTIGVCAVKHSADGNCSLDFSFNVHMSTYAESAGIL